MPTAPTRTASQLSCALYYARTLRWPVLPLFEIRDGCCVCSAGRDCPRPGKHPRIKGGVHSAATDLDQIRSWWLKWPNANIGVATGRESGIIVIDGDPRNGAKNTARRLRKELGPLPGTIKTRTGGNGTHFIFKYPDFEVRSDTQGKLLGPGLDVLSDGSYFIAPKSTHRCGEKYCWFEGRSPGKIEPAVLPKVWLKRLRQPPAPEVRKVRGDGATEIVEGHRNNHLTSVAGKLWRGGISFDALRAALLAENEKQCRPPLDAGEVEKIVTSITKYAPGTSVGNRSDAAEALMHSVLDQWFAGGKHLVFALDEQFWEFDGKLWHPVPDEWIKGKVLDAVQTSAVGSSQNTASLINQTLALLKAKLAAKEDRLGFVANPPQVINCANGEVWIAEDGSVEMKPHQPESFLRHCLKVNYDPDAKSPIYDKAVREIFSLADNPETMARHWNELVGYIIQPRRNIPLIAVLWESGDNGKTKLLATVIRLLGEQLVCAQPVENFEKNRFAMGSLFGKYLFADDDVRAGVKLPDGILKTISEAKIVTGEEKYRPAFNFVVRTVPVLLCNNVPSVADLSHGMLRRLTVIPFQRTFTDEDKDPALFERIWVNELSGILNHALKGLQRLVRRGSRFALPTDVKAATHRFIRDANPLPAFIADCCELGPDRACWMKDFYEAYCRWADDNGITLKQQQPTVRKNLEHMGYEIGHGNRGQKCYGLRLKSVFGAR